MTSRICDPEFLDSRTPGDRVENTVDLGSHHPCLLRSSNELSGEHGLADHVPRNQVVTPGSSGARVRETRKNDREDGWSAAMMHGFLLRFVQGMRTRTRRHEAPDGNFGRAGIKQA